MIGEKSSSKVANAVGGRTARACDSCLRRRARWFCAADDAFLCQPCDSSVHGANQLASRHERVRLQTEPTSPAWHRGFTRKPRTPRRHHKAKLIIHNDDDFVPEMSNESLVSDEEQLLYRVPVCKLGQRYFDEADHDQFDHQIQGFLDSELELAEFAADVESLLGVAGADEEDRSCRFEEFEGFDIDIDIDAELEPIRSVVKVEEELVDQPVLGLQPNPSSFSANDDEKILLKETMDNNDNKREITLSLNYEAVIAAWDSQGSPWTTGIRPNVKPEHGLPENCMDIFPTDFRQPNGDSGLGHIGSSGHSDGGREARVSRYREKRRTRLFSKKIRYEVRKLNAEKRPRMKGRFVKRTAASNFIGANHNNNPSPMIGSSTFPYHFMINK